MIVQPEMHLPHPGEEPAPQWGTGAADTDVVVVPWGSSACAREQITLASHGLCHWGNPSSLFLQHGRGLLPSSSGTESI